MAGLVPAIHVLVYGSIVKNVDARDKPGHDEGWYEANQTKAPLARGFYIGVKHDRAGAPQLPMHFLT